MTDKHENILTNLGSQFTKELEAVVVEVLANSGVKKNSDLASSVEWQYTRDSIQMVVNEYYKFVSEGRKPHVRKIPIIALIEFIKKNNIQSPKYSAGQLAFVLQRSIYKNGITGKHFLDQVQNTVADTVEIKVADRLEDFIGDSLYTAFNVQ